MKKETLYNNHIINDNTFNEYKDNIIEENKKIINFESTANFDNNSNYSINKAKDNNLYNNSKAYNNYDSHNNVLNNKNRKKELVFNLFRIYKQKEDTNLFLLLKRKFHKFLKFIKIMIIFNKENIRSTTFNDYIETSQEIKERLELKNCTFAPKISNYKLANRDSNIFERLHSEREIKDNKNRIQQLTYEVNNTSTFSPNLSLTASSNKKLNTNINNNDISFIERQLNYLNYKDHKKLNMKNKIEDEYNKIYSFSPKFVSKNKSELKKSFSKENLNLKTNK